MTAPLPELVGVGQGDVYKRGELAACLRRTRDGVEFRYLPSYLAKGGPPVATMLPLTAEPRLTPAGAVPPYFVGLLPEGRRLAALRRAVKTSADDDLSLLLAVGADVVGDVQVLPGGVTPHEVTPAVEVTDLTEVDFTELFARSVEDKPDLVGIPGIQDKISARMITLPVAREGDRFILKLNPPEFPGLVERPRSARDSPAVRTHRGDGPGRCPSAQWTVRSADLSPATILYWPGITARVPEPLMSPCVTASRDSGKVSETVVD